MTDTIGYKVTKQKLVLLNNEIIELFVKIYQMNSIKLYTIHIIYKTYTTKRITVQNAYILTTVARHGDGNDDKQRRRRV